MRGGSVGLSASALIVAVGMAGCLGVPEETDTDWTAQPVVFSSSPGWGPIAQVADDPRWRMAHAYGRAVARLAQSSGPLCSGAMVSSSLMLTAQHCVPRDVAWTSVEFGLLGATAAEQAAARVRARTRLMQLGVPYNDEPSVPDARIFRAGGLVEAREPGRDVALVSIGAVVADIHLDDGSNLQVQIPMGDIWGRVPVREYAPAPGRPGYALSVNQACGQTDPNVLLSPGATRASTGCLPGFAECFDTNADLLPGSSGGPFFDETLQQVIGVNHAEPFRASACSVSSSTTAGNTIARIGATVLAETRSQPPGGWADDLRVSNPTAWAGGTGGTAHVEPCHPGMLVRGLVGSTSPTGYVGNLGIVCAPRVGGVLRGLHSAVVFAPGSFDTDFATRRGQPFHEYFASVRTTTGPVVGEQTLALCPEGMFLRGLHLRAAGAVDRVLALECALRSNYTRTLTLPVQEHVGYLGTSSGGQARVLRCGPGAFVSGMTIRAGWHTDAFQLHCSVPPG